MVILQNHNQIHTTVELLRKVEEVLLQKEKQFVQELSILAYSSTEVDGTTGFTVVKSRYPNSSRVVGFSLSCLTSRHKFAYEMRWEFHRLAGSVEIGVDTIANSILHETAERMNSSKDIMEAIESKRQEILKNVDKASAKKKVISARQEATRRKLQKVVLEYRKVHKINSVKEGYDSICETLQEIMVEEILGS